MRRTLSWSRAAVLVCAAAAGSCGGSSPSPVSPAQSPVPQTPPVPPSNTWSVSGRLVETTTQQPVSGAQIAPSWDLAAVSTGSDGDYQLGAATNPPSTPYKLTVSGS